MFDRDEVFVGNRWRRSAGNDWLDVVSPSTEQIVGRVPAAVTADVDLAVALARTAFDQGPWPRLSIEERAHGLRAAVDAFERHQAEAIELQIDEMGGTRSFVEGVTLTVRATLDRFVKDVDLVGFSEIREGVAGDVLVVREPMGVTAGVTPWNGPLLVALTKIFPSLLMGCPPGPDRDVRHQQRSPGRRRRPVRRLQAVRDRTRTQSRGPRVVPRGEVHRAPAGLQASGPSAHKPSRWDRLTGEQRHGSAQWSGGAGHRRRSRSGTVARGRLGP
jgi:hypothetical protein